MVHPSHVAPRKEFWYPWIWWLGWPQNQSGWSWRKETLLPLSGFEPQTIQLIASCHANFATNNFRWIFWFMTLLELKSKAACLIIKHLLHHKMYTKHKQNLRTYMNFIKKHISPYLTLLSSLSGMVMWKKFQSKHNLK